MNNDLISRSALKKALTSETRDKFEFVCLSRVLEKIDNAPTVNPEKPIFSEIWYQERPQGKWEEKWIDGAAIYAIVHCSNCGEYGNPHYKYCPNCGAQMKNGE